jgi:hypothetical protein
MTTKIRSSGRRRSCRRRLTLSARKQAKIASPGSRLAIGRGAQLPASRETGGAPHNRPQATFFDLKLPKSDGR